MVGRIFLGIPLTDEVRQALAVHLEASLNGKPLPGRPVVSENWHLTLRFIGKVEEHRYDQMLRHLEEADLGPPLRLGFGGLGAFPRPTRATVLWLGVEEGAEALGRMAEAVEEAVGQAGLPPEERPFAAHLTLSRIRPHQDVHAVVDRVPPFPLFLGVDRLVVFRSHQGGGPPRYEELEAFPLG